MSLFKFSDIAPKMSAKSQDASGIALKPKVHFITGDKMQLLEQTIGSLNPGYSAFFKTDGAWSNIHLLEYILMQTGPANVYFSTWSISAEAISRFEEWDNQGLIKQLFVILDAGIRNRKPEIYQQAIGAFPVLKIAHCHAKVTVISNLTHQVSMIGSANYTRNPRIEAGMIIWDKSLADENIKWIVEEINK